MKVCKDHHAELVFWPVQIFLETDNITNKLIGCNQVIIERESKLLLGCSYIEHRSLGTVLYA